MTTLLTIIRDGVWVFGVFEWGQVDLELWQGPDRESAGTDITKKCDQLTSTNDDRLTFNQLVPKLLVDVQYNLMCSS